MMNFKLHKLDYYILLWVAYHIGLYFRISGSAIFLFITLVWSFYDMVRLFYLQRKKSKFLIIYTVFFLMLFFYGMLLAIDNEALYSVHGRVDKTQYIISITASLIPFYTFYRGVIERRIELGRVFYWIVPFFAVALFDYYLQFQMALQAVFGDIEYSEDVINGGSYVILGLMPFICLSKKRIMHVLLFAVCFYFIIIAFKRGPILISLICMIYYLFRSTGISNKKIGTTLLVVAASLIGYLFFSDFFAGSDLLQERWEDTIEGSSSGRDNIIALIFDSFLNSNIIQLLFGHGAYGSLVLTKHLAHNDWIQILIDQGIVGFIINGLLCWQLIRQWRLSDDNCNAQLSFGMFVIIYLLTSMVSMAFDRIPLYEMAVLAMVVAHNDIKTSFDCGRGRPRSHSH